MMQTNPTPTNKWGIHGEIISTKTGSLGEKETEFPPRAERPPVCRWRTAPQPFGRPGGHEGGAGGAAAEGGQLHRRGEVGVGGVAQPAGPPQTIGPRAAVGGRGRGTHGSDGMGGVDSTLPGVGTGAGHQELLKPDPGVLKPNRESLLTAANTTGLCLGGGFPGDGIITFGKLTIPDHNLRRRGEMSRSV